MDKIEKVKEWVQKQMELYWEKITDADDEHPSEIQLRDLGQYMAYESMESFLDTLSEEPDKSLEEAAEKWCKENGRGFVLRDKSAYYIGETLPAFIAGAEWQASQMPMPEDTVLFNKGVAEGRRLEREDMLKDAVEGYVNYYEDSGGILMAEAQVGCPYHNGDKVRIVVLKEEEE